MIVLDTNVLSEMVRRLPDAAVERWLAGQKETSMVTTCINEAELWAGIALLPHGARREALAYSVLRLFQTDLGTRVLPFDRNAVGKYGEIAASRRRAGRPFGDFDGLIAAIAAANGSAVATRDIGGFSGCGLTLINPWTGEIMQ